MWLLPSKLARHPPRSFSDILNLCESLKFSCFQWLETDVKAAIQRLQETEILPSEKARQALENLFGLKIVPHTEKSDLSATNKILEATVTGVAPGTFTIASDTKEEDQNTERGRKTDLNKSITGLSTYPSIPLPSHPLEQLRGSKVYYNSKARPV